MLLIQQAISRHVNEDPEGVRSRLVQHAGTEQMNVLVEEQACFPNGKLSFASAVLNMIDAFDEALSAQMTPDAKQVFTTQFSTTGSSDRIATGIALMGKSSSSSIGALRAAFHL